MIPYSWERIERMRICKKRRAELVEKFGLTVGQRRRLTMSRVEQLENCPDDDARRVLLGINKKIDPKKLNCEGV